MNIMKKFFSALLCIITCSLFFACTENTNNTNKNPTEGLQFEVSQNEGYCTLIGIGTATDTDIVIPSTYEGLTVKYIAERAFISNTTLESIEIPDSVVGIGEYAFYFCSKLESITMGDGVTKLGMDVFRGCENLQEVELSTNLTEIPIRAFLMCHRLTEVEIPQGVTKIETSAFESCISLDEVKLPSSIRSIGALAFAHDTKLKMITYIGTTAQWQTIETGESFLYRSAKEIRCSNGSLIID